MRSQVVSALTYEKVAQIQRKTTRCPGCTRVEPCPTYMGLDGSLSFRGAEFPHVTENLPSETTLNTNH